MKSELMDVPVHEALNKTLQIMFKFEKVSLDDIYFINFCKELKSLVENKIKGNK